MAHSNEVLFDWVMNAVLTVSQCPGVLLFFLNVKPAQASCDDGLVAKSPDPDPPHATPPSIETTTLSPNPSHPGKD